MTQPPRRAAHPCGIAWSPLSSLAFRALAMLLMVMSVALTVPYLGSARLGIWMTFSNMVALLSLLDIGLGNALLNRVAQLAARADRRGLECTVATGLALLVAIAAAASTVLCVLAANLPWGPLLQCGAPPASHAQPSCLPCGGSRRLRLCLSSAGIFPAETPGSHRVIERIIVDGLELALIVRSSFHAQGIEFFTPSSYSQQLGYMNWPAHHVIHPHIHNVVPRQVHYTKEVLFIRSGRLRVDFFSEDKKYLESRTLQTGDVILLASGGHGFEMLEPTEMFEVKQGPYTGETDKTHF